MNESLIEWGRKEVLWIPQKLRKKATILGRNGRMLEWEEILETIIVGYWL